MEKRYDEDRRLYEKVKPANRKLTYLPTLTENLKHVQFHLWQILTWDKFLELGGLSQF